MKTSTTLAVLAVVVLVTALVNGARRPAGTARDDKAAVSRMLADLDRVAAEADLDGFLDHVADDAVFLPPDRPAVIGKAAIREAYADLFRRFRLDVRHDARETDAFGGLIIQRGDVSGTMTPRAGGAAIPFNDKYLFVIRRQPDGSLRIWRAISNSNAPAAPAR